MPPSPFQRKTPDILALDTSTRTGWAHSDGSSGVLLLPERLSGQTNGERFSFLYDWLTDFVEQHTTRFIVYENGSHKRGGAPMEIGIGLPSIVCLFGYRMDVRVSPINSSSIKKHATGKGNADKPMMLAAARKRFPTVDFVKKRVKLPGEPAFEIEDDNQVDALWLLDLALGEINW